MKIWVGFYRQNKKLHMMTFEQFEINDYYVTGQGEDEIGRFSFNGSIQNNMFCALKIYERWNVEYKGHFDEEKREIFGYWKIDDQYQETFQIKEIDSKDREKYLLMHLISDC